MRKKIVLLFTFILAFALALCVAAGCSKDNGDGEVTVTISRTTLSLETHQTSGKITATASDGSEIVWTTSDETVASIAADGAAIRVTGEKVGTATVTATVKGGAAKAECAVTVKDPVVITFGYEDGSELKTDEDGTPYIEVDRMNTAGVQVTASASDSSAVTSWYVDDEDVATVEDGLVKGVHEGETVLHVRTSTGSGEIALKVIDTFEGESYDITTEQEDGKWYYHANTENTLKGEWTVKGELRGEEVIFEYAGDNWDPDDIFLALKDSKITNGWKKLSLSINSDTKTSVTINGTRVDLEKGYNDVTVCYEHAAGQAAVIISFYSSTANTYPKAMKVVVTDVNHEPHTVETLETPTLTYTAATKAVEIGGTYVKGTVKHYEIGFFKDAAATTPDDTKIMYENGTLVTTGIADGDYYLKVRAVGNPGYNDSDWSAATADTVNVDSSNVSYELSDGDGTHGAGSSAALTSGQWEYYVITEEAAAVKSASYANKTLTFEGQNGWCWHGVQLFYHISSFPVGATVRITMTVECTLGGRITVCGDDSNVLEAGVAKQITVLVKQEAGKPTIAMYPGAFAGADKDTMGNSKTPAEDSIAGYQNFVFKVSDLTAEEFVPEALKTPTAEYKAATGEGETATPATIGVTDTLNGKENVASYELGFFDGEDLVKTVLIASDGTYSDRSVPNGTYSLKVRALPATLEYSNSPWTEVIATGYSVTYDSTVEQMTEGSENGEWGAAIHSLNTPDTWIIWYENNKVTAKDVTTTGTGEEILDITFANNSSPWYGVQLFYKNTGNTAGDVYKLTFKIESSVGGKIQVNGTAVTLTAGETTDVEVVYTETGMEEKTGKASLALQFGTEADGSIAQGSFTITEVKWEKVEKEALETPSITVTGNNYTITDTENTTGVANYLISIYKDGALATSQTVTELTGALDDAILESGEYTVTVKAVGTLLYDNSAESAAANWNLEKTGGIQYNLAFGQANDDQWGSKGINVDGKYYYWNDQSWAGATVTMNGAQTYNDGTITLDYTCTAGGTEFAVQILRKSEELTAGAKYTLSFKINVTNATTIKINGAEKTLVAGDNDISIEYTAVQCVQSTDSCIFSMQIAANFGQANASNTVVISDIVYTPVAE